MSPGAAKKEMNMSATAQSATVIDADFRVVATTDRRPSPNRRRAAARIALWNTLGLFALVALPMMF